MMRSWMVLLLGFATNVAAFAQFGYAFKGVPIKAGILLIESQRVGPGNGVPANPTPHVWYALDLDRTAKLPGWTFYNPLAQTVVTQGIVNRWSQIPTAGPIPPVGTRLDKRSAPYWEVSLQNTADNVLQTYDVLLLSLDGYLSLNPGERDKLRRYLDKGGVLWLDVISTGNPSGRIDTINSAPLPFELSLGTGGLTANPFHAILYYPHYVSLEDLTLMQFGGTDVVGPVTTGSLGTIAPIQGWLPSDSYRIDPVAGYGGFATVGVAQLGHGFMVVTTRGLSATLNRGLNGQQVVANQGFTALAPAFDGSFTAAAKLVVNAVSLTSGYTTPGKGSRKTNSGPVDIAAPLLNRFTAPIPGGNFTASRPPAIFKGLVVCTTDTRVIVLDADPSVDYDGDGNPDDGMVDAPDFAGDVVWQSQALPAPLSAATCIEVPEVAEAGVLVNPTRGGALVTDQVLVVDGQGRLHIFDLQYNPQSANLNNVAPISTVAPPDTSTLSPDGANAPTAHEGLAFVADTRNSDGLGRVWVADLRTGTAVISTNPWAISQSGRLQPPSAGPTVGYIPIADASGGLDRVVYVPTINNPGTGRGAGIVSLWLGARGEKPVSVQLQGGLLRVTTRASQAGLPIVLPGASSSLGVKISVLKSNGDPFTTTEVQNYFTGTVTLGGSNGELLFGLTAAGQQLDWNNLTINTNDDASLRVDYTIDWGAVGIGNNQAPPDAFVRGNLILPDDSDFARRILGNLALSDRGHLFAVSAAPIDATGAPTVAQKYGSLYNFREEGRGAFKLVYRWDLYRDHVILLNSGQSQADQIPYREAIIDEEGFIQALPNGFVKNLLSAPITNLAFQGGPTVKGNVVYVAAGGVKSNVVRVTGLIALDAHPAPAEFLVENAPSSFNVAQRDVNRSSNKSQPELLSELRSGQFTVERVGGTTLTRIRMESMMSVAQGQIRDAISANLPIILRNRGQANTDIIIEPELSAPRDPFAPGFAGGKFSPELWYTVFSGLGRASQPLVTGQTLYLGGASVLPSLFQTPFQGFFESGMMIGMDSEIAQNDAFMAANSVRPWQSQLSQAKGDPSPPGFIWNTDFRWPQITGIQSFDDYRVRLLQTALPEPRALGLVGGDGTLAVIGASTIYGFNRYDFYIADENRVGRFDANGNPIWALDHSVRSGASGPVVGVGNVQGISKPTRVYASGSNTYWVVDSGADRVVRYDASGRELRSLHRFKVDPKYLPAGAPDNLKLELRSPKDVLVFQTMAVSPSYLSNPKPYELWVHYLIADSGNFRMVELIDRYEFDPVARRVIAPIQYVDPESSKPGQVERAFGVLLWHSPPELSGKQFAYNSISRVFVDDGQGGRKAILAFGFGNFEPGKASFGLDTTNQDQDKTSGFGGIVLYDGAQSSLITKVVVPAMPADIFWNDNTSSWNSAPIPTVEKKIAGLSSVTMKYVNDFGIPRLAVMFSDVSGVYEVVNRSADVWEVRWMMPNDAFRVMRRNSSDVPTSSNPRNARLVYARRLDSGDVVIVNNYVGSYRNGQPYMGEICMVEGLIDANPLNRGFDWNKRNLGFNSMSVQAELPPIQGTRGLVAPIFGDRR